ncbi:MAG: ornithine carbamoyltransferase [Leucothrix sp.]
MSTIRHFLTLKDFSPNELNALIQRAIQLKQQWQRGNVTQPMQQRTLAMIFEKSSTRTRVSFETGITQLGGHGLFLSPQDTQLGRGEPVEDSARVISRMVDMIMVRTFDHQQLERFAEFSDVPVINALTDDYHPCQLLADVMTYVEHRGSITGKTVTWVGDGNNMCQSWMNAAKQFDFKLKIACPEGYDPKAALLDEVSDRVEIVRDIKQAVDGADLVSTDVWASMGQEQEQALRVAAFKQYQVNAEVMQHAKTDALFMHCLPAHREEEVTAEVLEGPQSVVWDEAENRLHAQKALMERLAINSGLIS